MAVVHRAWLFHIPEAARAFVGLRGLDDVLASAVTAQVRSIATDPERLELLVTARLDPSDEEALATTLEPTPDDFGLERAAADRLSLLLAGVCRKAGALSVVPPNFVEELLRVCGWPAHRINICLRGTPVSSLLRRLAPTLAPVLDACGNWLVGGWLDHEAARSLLHDLETDVDLRAKSALAMLSQLASESWMHEADVAAKLHAGLAELRFMLTQIDREDGLWIIQD